MPLYHDHRGRPFYISSRDIDRHTTFVHPTPSWAPPSTHRTMPSYPQLFTPAREQSSRHIPTTDRATRRPTPVYDEHIPSRARPASPRRRTLEVEARAEQPYLLILTTFGNEDLDDYFVHWHSGRKVKIMHAKLGEIFSVRIPEGYNVEGKKIGEDKLRGQVTFAFGRFPKASSARERYRYGEWGRNGNVGWGRVN